MVAVYLRAVLGWLRGHACGDGVADGRGGGVAIVQRFGGALNLNVHVHALVLDGVFVRDGASGLEFHAVPPLTALDVEEVLATVEPQMMHLLERRGLGEHDEDGGAPDAWEEEAPVLAGLAAASVQGTVALGRHRGTRVGRLGDPPEESEGAARDRCHARSNGFDLHAGVVVPAGRQERLARVCRYALRPPVAGDRVRVTGDGQVQLQLRHRWADGGRLRLIALIEQAAVVGRILRYLGQPSQVPEPRAARDPPLPGTVDDAAGWHDDTSTFEPCS